MNIDAAASYIPLAVLVLLAVPLTRLPRGMGLIAPGASLVLGLILSGTSGTIAILALFVGAACLYLLAWIAGQVYNDVSRMISPEGGEVSPRHVRHAAKWALIYSLPAVLFVWASFDFAEITERRAMYGCTVSDFPPNSYYGFRSNDDMIYGRKEPNGEKYFSADGETADLPFSIPYVQGPVFWTAWAMRQSSPASENWHCPERATSENHEKNAVKTVEEITKRLKDGLLAKYENASASADWATTEGEQVVRKELFGASGHGCRLDDRGFLPDQGECLVGALPRSCGLLRWVRRTGQCIERMVKKPIIRTYENWRSNFYQSYLEKAAAAQKARDAGSEKAGETIESFINTELNNLQTTTIRNVRFGFWVWAFVGWLGIISALSFVSKTFLTLLARNVFSDEVSPKNDGSKNSLKLQRSARISLIDPDTEFDLDPIDAVTQISPIQYAAPVVGTAATPAPPGGPGGFRTFSLPASNGKGGAKTWFVYDNVGVSWAKYGRALVLFRLTDAWLPRARAGKATVHRLEEVGRLGANAGRVQHDREILQLDLRDNQKVVINLSKVLAFEGSVRFRSEFMPRLGAFFQKRLWYPVAFAEKGGGKILFIGDGRAMGIVSYGSSDAFIDPASVAAMDKCGSYQGAASLGGLSPYYRPVTIGPADSSTVMLAANSTSDAAMGLMARLRGLVWFLFPF